MARRYDHIPDPERWVHMMRMSRARDMIPRWQRKGVPEVARCSVCLRRQRILFGMCRECLSYELAAQDGVVVVKHRGKQQGKPWQKPTPLRVRQPFKVLKHGTVMGYNRGCKCQACLDGAAKYQREYRLRKKEKKET